MISMFDNLTRPVADLTGFENLSGLLRYCNPVLYR